jgi:Tfp pilus assembly protein PilN
VLALVLASTLALLSYMIVRERSDKSDVLAATAEAEQQLATLAAEQNRLETMMRRAENADVLERSVFLNTLIARKGVSWTKLFADMETVLPHNVRLVSIRPQTNARNEIQLDMVIGSQTAEPVIEFLKRMEGSEMFSHPTVANSLPPSQTDPLYRYRVSVNYAQKL